MKRKKWVISSYDKDMAAEIAEELNIGVLPALIASSRGFCDPVEAADFFDTDTPLTLSPFSIKDMDRAAERVKRAIDNFEQICVYGDYDCDGVTATALLYSYLLDCGANVVYYIPDRISEGYGMNRAAVEKLSSMGVKLIVTVDNGISSFDEIALAYSLNMQVVVTDHHKPGEKLPQCEAVVNPHRADCPSHFKEMSGVGVAYKLVCAIDNSGRDEELLIDYSDLIAIGTIGDVVSLTGENRVMVRKGLEKLQNDPSPGVAALIEIAQGSKKSGGATSVAFTVCPRINAAGRMDSAEKALALLLSDNDEDAAFLAKEVNELNIKRQSTEAGIFKQALDMLENDPEGKRNKVIVAYGEGWHEGVIGIVAAKLCDLFDKPTIVLSVNNGVAKGSCRSVEGFSIFDALTAVSSHLVRFGGHEMAAGLTVKEENIPAFIKAINDYAAGFDFAYSEITIDCKLNLQSITPELVDEISLLEPFGAGNKEPLFGIFGVTVEDTQPLSEFKHTKVTVSKNGTSLPALCFGLNPNLFPFEKGDKIDLAVNLDINTYNGVRRVSLLVRNMRYSSLNEDFVLRNVKILGKFNSFEKIDPAAARYILPDRETQVKIFRAISERPVLYDNIEQLCIRLSDNGKSYAKYAIALEAMLETGILVNDNGLIMKSDTKSKVDLNASQVMKRLNGYIGE